MTGYPLLLDLTGRRVVVVGGGMVASRRVRGLTEAGADVLVVAPELRPEVADAAARAERRPFVPADLDGAWLAVACADDPAVNAAVA
ncbi:MAG TPA: NAD(P)-dependent oxidoreductase, partial [Jatrophihabitans sp.]|nr:NAD(P)-dependent oxidoreductase [Jatrophihabitans sp.]